MNDVSLDVCQGYGRCMSIPEGHQETDDARHGADHTFLMTDVFFTPLATPRIP
jgi:hypothetical protein